MVSAEFTPVRPGRRVELQQRHGNSWTKIAMDRLDGQGRVEFSVPTRRDGRPVKYRATERPAGGLTGRHTKTVRSTSWGNPDFLDEVEGTTLGPAWNQRIQFPNPWGGRECSKGSPAATTSATVS